VGLDIDEAGGGEAEIDLNGSRLRAMVKEGRGFKLRVGVPARVAVGFEIEALSLHLDRYTYGPRPARWLKATGENPLKTEFSGNVREILSLHVDEDLSQTYVLFCLDVGEVTMPSGVYLSKGETLDKGDALAGTGVLSLSDNVE